jgi:hypothetical protein
MRGAQKQARGPHHRCGFPTRWGGAGRVLRFGVGVAVFCSVLLALLQAKVADDTPVPPAPNDNQDHLFYEITGTPSFCFSSFQTHNLEGKHSVFSSQSLFQLVVHNSHRYLWVIDTGATYHIVCSVSLLTSITSLVIKKVRLPNGNSAVVTHIGIVRISVNLILTNVLCVPSFSFNLISVSKLVKFFKCYFIFLSEFCFIQQVSGWKMIGLGKEIGGLDHLLLHNLDDLSPSSVLAMNYVSITPASHIGSTLPSVPSINNSIHILPMCSTLDLVTCLIRDYIYFPMQFLVYLLLQIKIVQFVLYLNSIAFLFLLAQLLPHAFLISFIVIFGVLFQPLLQIIPDSFSLLLMILADSLGCS